MSYKEMYSLFFYGARTVLKKERMDLKIYKETLNNKWKGFKTKYRMLLSSAMDWTRIKQ